MTLWQRLTAILERAAAGGAEFAALFQRLVERAAEAIRRGAEPEDRPLGVAFTIAIIALLAKMARADGAVTASEAAAFQALIHVPPGEAGNVARVFDLARTDTAGFEHYARQMARLCAARPGVLEDVLDALAHVAMADGAPHAAERTYLRRVAEIFGFGEAEADRIFESHMAPERADPWAVLGVAHGALPSEIRQAWLRLVKENHPDAMRARGVPDEFLQLADEKLAAINAAYDRIGR